MTLKTFKWNAPTERTDGSPLEGPISYNLYINDVGIVSFPGSLNPDGSYEFKREFPHGDYVAEITAVDDGGLESSKSNSVPFTVRSAPAAPANLAVS